MADCTPTTFLALGQRYAPAGSPAWRADRQLTVLHIGRDRQGLLHVAYRCPAGHQVVEPTAQFDAAVASGQLVPFAGPGRPASC